MEQVKADKLAKNDLPATGETNSRVNGLISAMSGPTDMVELKAALFKHGGKVKHVGGALPPLFPEKGIREGDARLVNFIGHEIVPEERSGGGGGAFAVLNFDVLDHNKPTFPVAYRAQMILNATLETYFEATPISDIDDKKEQARLLSLVGGDGDFKVPLRDPDKTPILIITYGGQMVSKKQGFSGAKRWIVEEYTPAKS